MAVLTPQFFHPTTIVFVDDDLSAINNITMSLPSNFSVKTFSMPEEALKFLNSNDRMKPLHDRGLTLISDINHFENEMNNHDRFKECCIVIADYAMPSMNGIEFCKAIEDSNVYKILLTGLADEKLAVEAFNEEIIHRFFMKQDSEVLPKIRSTVEAIQKKYFCRISNYVSELIQYATPPFLQDPVFRDFFEYLVEERKICEYYMSNKPYGFTLIDENGGISRMVIYTEKDFEFQLKMAISRNAPEELKQKLQPNEVKEVPYFWQDSFGIYNESIVDWQENFYPACHIAGEVNYYYNVIDKPQGYSELAKDFVGFFDYLDQLETND